MLALRLLSTQTCTQHRFSIIHQSVLCAILSGRFCVLLDISERQKTNTRMDEKFTPHRKGCEKQPLNIHLLFLSVSQLCQLCKLPASLQRWKATKPTFLWQQPPIILFTCHSVPLSIKWTTKHQCSSPGREFLLRKEAGLKRMANAHVRARWVVRFCLFSLQKSHWNIEPDLQALATLIVPRLSKHGKGQSCVSTEQLDVEETQICDNGFNRRTV